MQETNYVETIEDFDFVVEVENLENIPVMVQQCYSLPTGD